MFEARIMYAWKNYVGMKHNYISIIGEIDNGIYLNLANGLIERYIFKLKMKMIYYHWRIAYAIFTSCIRFTKV